MDGESRPLNVLIIGAGIGGLTAAIALRQQGHNIEIFEQSRLAQETGAAIHLAPNANGLLRRLGLYVENIGAVECKGITEFNPDGSFKFSIDLSQVNKMWQHPWHLVHRAHLHTALKEMATGESGKGRRAKLHVASRVKTVDAESATIIFEDDSKAQGDLLIGADGVHSITRRSIPGGDLTPFDCGKSAFRFMIPTDALASDSETRSFVEKDDTLTMWIGVDRRLIMYPCVSKTVMNFVGIHPSRETAEDIKGQGWQETGSKSKMAQLFSNFGSGVASILDKADEEKIKVWRLLDMKKMPSFIHHRLAVMGDAAHPFLPHQGQGGGQAIEDAVSLAALLPLGTDAAAIQERLKVYESCRYERAHTVQESTRLAGRDKDEIEATGQQLDMQKYTAYNFGHDEWDASSLALRKHIEARNPDVRHRAPYGFGPAPGPRQPLGLSPSTLAVKSLKDFHQERFKTYSVRFRSSRTYLETFLPPGFAFTSPATVASASFSCTELNDLIWLGGYGYRHLGLYLHGVNYTKRDGSKTHGTYIPILFENFADPIMTGRDEVGYPKVYADIDVQSNADDSQCTISLSWKGMEFGKIGIRDLKKEESNVNGVNGTAHQAATPGPPPPLPEEGNFAYRYIPAVGQPSKTDAEYAVFSPFPKEDEDRKTGEKLTTTSASVDIKSRDWQALPTLHHIAKALEAVPIYGIEKAEVVQGAGVGDLGSTVRLE